MSERAQRIGGDRQLYPNNFKNYFPAITKITQSSNSILRLISELWEEKKGLLALSSTFQTHLDTKTYFWNMGYSIRKAKLTRPWLAFAIRICRFFINFTMRFLTFFALHLYGILTKMLQSFQKFRIWFSFINDTFSWTLEKGFTEATGLLDY